MQESGDVGGRRCTLMLPRTSWTSWASGNLRPCLRIHLGDPHESLAPAMTFPRPGGRVHAVVIHAARPGEARAFCEKFLVSGAAKATQRHGVSSHRRPCAGRFPRRMCRRRRQGRSRHTVELHGEAAALLQLQGQGLHRQALRAALESRLGHTSQLAMKHKLEKGLLCPNLSRRPACHTAQLARSTPSRVASSCGGIVLESGITRRSQGRSKPGCRVIPMSDKSMPIWRGGGPDLRLYDLS